MDLKICISGHQGYQNLSLGSNHKPSGTPVGGEIVKILICVAKE